VNRGDNVSPINPDLKKKVIVVTLMILCKYFMETTDVNSTLIEGYLKMLDNLSPSTKLDLISKLTESVKADLTNRKSSFYDSFGAWDSAQSAEEIIKQIKESRSFNREIEPF
jgi:hypothetical protein